MTLPKEARLEVVLPGKIAIYDVSDILPKPTNPRSNRRPIGIKIVRVFFHNSGAYGADGFEGARNSIRYVIQKRNFGARPYHYWLSYKPEYDDDGNMIIYRLAQDDERAWHTGQRCNDEGVGVVWQGNLHPGKTGQPSDEQFKMAEALTDWLVDRHELNLPDGLSFHAEAKQWGARKNKATCPGPYVEEWVEERRNRLKVTTPEVQQEPEPKPKLNKPKVNKKKPAPQKKGWLDKWVSNLFTGKKKK